MYQLLINKATTSLSSNVQHRVYLYLNGFLSPQTSFNRQLHKVQGMIPSELDLFFIHDSTMRGPKKERLNALEIHQSFENFGFSFVKLALTALSIS
jgi:hypothetical protein